MVVLVAEGSHWQMKMSRKNVILDHQKAFHEYALEKIYTCIVIDQLVTVL